MDNAHQEPGNRVKIGDIVADFDRNIVETAHGDQRMEPRIARLFAVLIDNSGQVVTRDALIDDVWNGAHGADQSLSNAISQLRKLLSECDATDLEIETVPKRGYRFIAPAPPSPMASAVPEAPTSDAPPRVDNRHVALAVLTGLLLIPLAIYALASFSKAPAPIDHGADNGNGRFTLSVVAAGEGVPQEIIKGLDAETRRIFAGNSLVILSGEGPETQQAEFSMKASLSRVDDALHGVVDLVQAETGAVLWSFEGERAAEESDIFREAFPWKLSNIVRCALNFRERLKSSVNAEIFTLLFNYCERTSGSTRDWLQLSELGRRLIALAPGSAEAYATYGAATAFSIYFHDRLPLQEADAIRDVAYENLDKALELEPSNGSALSGRAIVHDPDVGVAEREGYLRRALIEDPGFLWSRNQLGNLLVSVGRREDATVFYEDLMSDAPYEYWGYLRSAELYIASGHEQFAKSLVEPFLERFPDDYALVANWLEPLVWFGEPDDVRDFHERFFPGHPSVACVEMLVKNRERNTVASISTIESLCAPFDFARFETFAYFGHVDRAYEALQKQKHRLAEPSGVWARRSLFLPIMRPVHEDPRFMPFAEEIGLVDYWLAVDKWPDFCAADDFPYDCRDAAIAAKENAQGLRAD